MMKAVPTRLLMDQRLSLVRRCLQSRGSFKRQASVPNVKRGPMDNRTAVPPDQAFECYMSCELSPSRRRGRSVQCTAAVSFDASPGASARRRSRLPTRAARSLMRSSRARSSSDNRCSSRRTPPSICFNMMSSTQTLATRPRPAFAWEKGITSTWASSS